MGKKAHVHASSSRKDSPIWVLEIRIWDLMRNLVSFLKSAIRIPQSQIHIPLPQTFGLSNDLR